MDVAENIFVDGDVNDPNTPEASNDLGAQSQKLAAPAKVVGFVTALPTTIDGDRFATESDEWDVYELPLQSGETVTLSVSDWLSTDPLANDIDLYLVKADDIETVIDSSENATQTEWVNAPESGVYLVGVHAFSGTSNYLLKSGQSSPVGSSRLSSSAAMAEGELVAATRLENNSIAGNSQKSYQSRIERIEKENALTRIKENSDGEVLYKVDTSRVDQLVPHPLTVNGWGAITPENWQVIRAAKELSVSGDYRWSGPNYIMKEAATPNDTHYGLQWHYPLINLPQAWNVTTGSKDIVVAVIDSGVYDHPDLVSNVDYSLGYDFVASTFNSGDGDGIDPDASDPGKSFPETRYKSHGTHVAGTIGATSNNGYGVAGVTWDVTIMPVRVLGNDGFGSCWDVLQGAKWAGGLANDSGEIPSRIANIINMSLGSSEVCGVAQELVDQLVAKGIIIVAAAGNEASSLPNYPAALDDVISIGATTIVDELAYYSNFGSTIDMAAPGGDGYSEEILSTLMVVEQGTSAAETGFEALSGTSMASPHVAGVAALMKSVYAEMGPNEFLTAISSGAITKDLAQDGASIKDPLFGYGRIDAQKAVNWALEQDGNPVPPYLTSSIASANFGSTQLSINFEIGKGGSGEVSVVGADVFEHWMQLNAISTDTQGLGTYRIDVDRINLTDGSYSGWVVIHGSDGSQISISVTMHVGEKVVGQAGYQYALLLDNWTLSNVKQWDGLAVNQEYPVNFNNIPPGGYFLIVGSDIDNDQTICDEGELCQIYPLNSLPVEIIVSDQNINLGRFTMGFPANITGSSISSFGASETQNEKANISNIKAMISASGVSIEK